MNTRAIRILRSVSLALALVAAAAPAAPASAATMTWQVRSFSSKAVDVAFYSQNRRHEWPGNAKTYLIRDYKVAKMRLTCVPGEKICYGAWIRNAGTTYWGAGPGGRQTCTNCCFTCEGDTTTPIMNLNER